jgi:hypothetical protein
MDRYKETILLIDSGELTIKQLVSIMILVVSKININTISGMSRSEGKTPRGILISNKYKKTYIGDQKMCIEGLCEDNFPF